MNPIGALILAFLASVLMFGSRRWALLAMAAGALCLTQGVTVQVLGLNLFAVRFLEMAGFLRVMARGEFSFSRLNSIDRALILLYGYTTVIYLIRSREEMAYQIGLAVDAFLAYFTARGLLRSMEDWRWFLRSFALLLVPYVALVMVESFTHRNLFTLTGAIPNSVGEWSRGGRIRCFGSFRHPSLLGTIAVSFIPLYIGMAFAAVDRARALLAIALCLVIVWAANSGGPVSGVAAGVLAWFTWRLRTKMQWVRRGMVALFVMAALLMKAPVWYLIMHVSDITGGDGWHRAFLIDTTYQHLSFWWLAGMPLSGTAGWFAYDQPVTGGADITNQFVAFGLAAGLGAVALFLLLLTRAYSSIGTSAAVLRAAYPASRESEYLLWGLGCMLTAHIANWLGITYFDQTYLLWFMQLAAISTLTQHIQSSQMLTSEADLAHERDLDGASPVSAES
jgi:hypothetical protein